MFSSLSSTSYNSLKLALPERSHLRLASSDTAIAVEKNRHHEKFEIFLNNIHLLANFAVNGFIKKTLKTPKSDIELEEKLKKQYFDEKDK